MCPVPYTDVRYTLKPFNIKSKGISCHVRGGMEDFPLEGGANPVVEALTSNAADFR